MQLSTEDTVFKRITGKGGYGGYPAVILLDIAFLSPDNRWLLPQKLASCVGRGMQAWRVIEISPDYFNIGYCTYAMSAQG
jgi:hypothetical protein